MTRILERRTLVFALCVLALVLAMSSTAWAAGRNSVDSRAIKNGSVKTADLAKGAVTSAKVRDGKLKGADLADGSVGSADLADGSVGSADLANGSVGSADLADGAVTGTDIANGSVEGTDLANGSVEGTDLADESVGSADLANGSVMSADIADGSVTGTDLADGGVSGEDIAQYAVGPLQLGWIDNFFTTTGNITDADGSTNGGSVGTASATANCPAGSQVLSGGAEWVNASSGSVTDKNLYIHTSRRSGNGWFVRGIVDYGAQGTVQLRVHVDCLMQGAPQL
jgi:trimeric autotransporter adhesin